MVNQLPCILLTLFNYMKLTASHYYLVLLVTTVLVIVGVGVSYILSNQTERPVSRTRNSVDLTLVKQENTLLGLHVSPESSCYSEDQLLSIEQLLALPQQEFSTLHTWTEVKETFSGPLLEDVVNLICKGVVSVELKALNDYSITVDFEGVKQYKPIIAHSINGQRLSIRDKGPLWVMVDYETHNLDSKNLESLMVWQLSDIVILRTE